MEPTLRPDGTILEKLVSSIKQPKLPSESGNLMCFYEENLVVWNGVDQCLSVCSLDDQHSITNIKVITLTNPPVFVVSTLTPSPLGDYLALSGSNGLMVVELPAHWTLHHSESNVNAPAVVARSTSIGERMFLCNQNFKLLCLRWHPASRQHIIVLNNDDCLRLFDIDNEFEPIKTIFVNQKNSTDLHFERISLYSNSFGENAVSFDFGPSLARYHHIETLEIYPIYILTGNGDVLLLYLSLNDLFVSNEIFGPLKMTPAAEDNYGSDACSILCLDSVPPMLVIGTTTGLLYHCLAIESECGDEQHDGAPQEMYFFTTSSGIQVAIPETVLYVLETIELSFPLASADHDAPLFNTNELNTSLQLIADIRDPKRYFCLHSFGVHIVMLSFLKQLLSPNFSEFRDERSIVEYLICTKPTIEKSAIFESESKSFPVGVALFVTRGFTYITVLLNSAELICKRLSNIILPDSAADVFPVKNGEIDLDYLLTPGKKAQLKSGKVSNPQTSSSPQRKVTFPEHIEKILRRNTSLPLIKSSKGKNSAVGVQELQMLLNSIDVLKREYLEKFSLAAKSIEQRKKVLKSMCQVQLEEVANLNTEKEHILSNYVNLVKKYEQVKDSQNNLSDRLDKKITEIQYQRPTLSDAELNLKYELSKEQENILLYRQKLEQIKRKHRYQDAQLRKSMISEDRAQKGDFMLSSQLKNVKDMLASQGEQISELVTRLNNIKSSS